MLLRVRVSVIDRPGALLAVAKVVADAGGNIVDIEILATGDGKATDDLVIDMPNDDRDGLVAHITGAGAEVLNVRRTVRLAGQRPDLDLLTRVSTAPEDAVGTLLSLAPAVWSADWAAVVIGTDFATARSSPGAPRPLPDGLPVPGGPLPRRGTAESASGQRWEVVGTPWRDGLFYLGRADGPTFLQVELIQLRRVLELATALVTRG